jgi:hypothetical protein
MKAIFFSNKIPRSKNNLFKKKSRKIMEIMENILKAIARSKPNGQISIIELKKEYKLCENKDLEEQLHAMGLRLFFFIFSLFYLTIHLFQDE